MIDWTLFLQGPFILYKIFLVRSKFYIILSSDIHLCYFYLYFIFDWSKYFIYIYRVKIKFMKETVIYLITFLYGIIVALVVIAIKGKSKDI
jgi:hypothetical protein